MNILAIISGAALTRVEIEFLEFFFIIDGGMRLCHYAHAGVYKRPFHLSSQDLSSLISNRCPESAKPGSTL